MSKEPLLNFFISSAYAESSNNGSAVSPQGGGLSMLLMVAIFFGFIYFTVWRPQMKRNKEQQNLLNALAIEDEVMTVGGLFGKVNKLTDTHVLLTIASGVEIIIQKSAVTTILPKGTLKAIENQ